MTLFMHIAGNGNISCITIRLDLWLYFVTLYLISTPRLKYMHIPTTYHGLKRRVQQITKKNK